MIHLRDSLRKIRNNEVQLGQLLDSASGTAFIATDLEGVITWFSPGAEQLLGYSADDVVGRTTPMPFHESREILSRAQKLRITPGYEVVTHPVAHGADQDTRDWTYVRKDGSRLTVSVSVTAVRDDDGNPVELPQRRPRRDRPSRRRAGPGLRPRQGARDQPADARPRPRQGRVRLGGEPRAAHPADQHRRLHRAARRRHVRQPHRGAATARRAHRPQRRATADPGRGPAHDGAGRGRQPLPRARRDRLRDRRPGGHRRGRALRPQGPGLAAGRPAQPSRCPWRATRPTSNGSC